MGDNGKRIRKERDEKIIGEEAGGLPTDIDKKEII